MRRWRVLRGVLSERQDLHHGVPRATQLQDQPTYVLSGLRRVTVVVLFDCADAPIREHVLRWEQAGTAAIRTRRRAVVTRDLALSVAGQACVVFLNRRFHRAAQLSTSGLKRRGNTGEFHAK